MLLNILAVGDVVGEGGQDILHRRLPKLREETGAHFAVVNGENASGVGITPAQARRILDSGADVITLGNHTWNRIQIGAFLDKDDRILRPANYAGRVPGRGFGVYQCQGLRLGVLKDLSSMRRYCWGRESGAITGGTCCQNYGFVLETDRYLYRLRCNPAEGDYQAYLGCFDKQAQKQEMGLTEKGRQALRGAADPAKPHSYSWCVIEHLNTPET